MKKRQTFVNGYTGTELLKSYFLNEKGVWRILGEDPNCDMAGSHSQPFLCLFSGTLDQAINHAISLPSFFTWGSGGTIIKEKVEGKRQLDYGEVVKALRETTMNGLTKEQRAINEKLLDINQLIHGLSESQIKALISGKFDVCYSDGSKGKIKRFDKEEIKKRPFSVVREINHVQPHFSDADIPLDSALVIVINGDYVQSGILLSSNVNWEHVSAFIQLTPGE